ncbi:hypothetical protein GCM10022222_61930 [Amycolatopsis ultiminotia]|uniref:Uncharacterized protein n=1 Tax=Amycolatopsis ultiminotia TaxID=543629 RepID=A0ABP6XM15_9PSEU
MYACFSCFTVYDQGQIGGCSRCHNGVYVRTPTDKLEEDGEIDVCSSCWDYIISRD